MVRNGWATMYNTPEWRIPGMADPNPVSVVILQCVYDVVIKSSRSLSHLVMSFLFTIHQRIQYKLCILMYGAAHWQTSSPIWLHWHQLRQAGHIFALPTDSPSTSLGHRQGWAIVHSRSLVHAPGTHFLLTFVVQPAWTLLRSVSNHICFLPLTSYNNFFILVTVYCSVFYVLSLFVQY